MPPQCSFGKFLNSECHRNLKPSITSLSEFEDHDQSILKMRAGMLITDLSILNICRYHELHYGEYFERRQTKCCDIFQKHKKKTVGSHTLSMDMAVMLQSKGYAALPGWKLCRHCFDAVKNLEDSGTSEEEVDLDSHLDRDDKCDKLNESLGIFGISPLKSHGLQKSTRISIAQEKLEPSYEKQKEAVADILKINSPEFGSPIGSQVSERQITTKAADLDRLMDCMKEKLKGTLTTSEKIQLMTLAPASWSHEKVRENFGVSEYIVREARALAGEERDYFAT